MTELSTPPTSASDRPAARRDEPAQPPRTAPRSGKPARTIARREELAQEFMSLMPQLRRRFEAGLPDDLREKLASVTPHQLEALCHLGGGSGATMHELAQAQGCSTSSATALADRLIGHGLAKRAADADDRRVVRLVPTARAAELIDRYRTAKRQTVMTALSSLSRDEIAELIRLFRRVAVGGDA